jgi:hypothetical protein
MFMNWIGFRIDGSVYDTRRRMDTVYGILPAFLLFYLLIVIFDLKYVRASSMSMNMVR